jgi:hypothetical protein
LGFGENDFSNYAKNYTVWSKKAQEILRVNDPLQNGYDSFWGFCLPFGFFNSIS